jgi:peptide/nickel transport system permease protein
MGKTAVNGAITGDIPVVLGVTVVASLVVLLSNLAIDVLQPIVNPRLRT